MEELESALQLVDGYVAATALIFIRVGAVMALLPAFGEEAIPARVKLGATIAFSMIVVPIVLPRYAEDIDQGQFLKMIGPEVVAGLILGILFRFFVIALQVAGTVAGQSTSLAQIFGAGVGAEPQPTSAPCLSWRGFVWL